MNRFFAFTIFFAVTAMTSTIAQSNAAAELSFVFTRQSGSASNQFAVWVEDTQGQYIKTLYATRYTANGGYEKRPSSIPVWVKQSGLAGLTKAQVDSLTGATPRTGTLTYQWDGTNSQNTALPPGDYVIVLEGTLRQENQVLYRAPIRLGQGPATPQVTTEYIGNAGSEKSMIGSVVVKTLR